eukprot:TRINITY_DN6747_c0_g1_i2.p1 TRINITY_DN6747_c0_g1~~TRINITY_DN6747_c0_g1_i2.p1  ORF type:complete len:285 (+),score=68.69 TRINITY_DN6747_c0_g1_i2:7-861(+)
MARSSEKAQSMLNRWVAQRSRDRVGYDATRKPTHTSQCNNAMEAQRWRALVVRDISRKVSILQNDSLGEYRIRELNDEINNLLREKSLWEKRILELGGTTQKGVLKSDFAVDVVGKGGYKYFGQAKNLPGVKELLEGPNAESREPRKTRSELFKLITADYYGFRDEEDGALAPLEQAAEERTRREAVARWEDQRRERRERLARDHPQGIAGLAEDIEEQLKDDPAELAEEFGAPEDLPSKEQIAQDILEEQKRHLMEQYVSEELRSELDAAAHDVGVVTGKVHK